MAEYAFLTTWLLQSPREPVWEAIHDQASWPRWWRGVETAEEISRPAGGGDVGAVARMVWKSALPYRVEFEVTTTRVERPTLLEGRARGDLEGTGRWRFYEQDGITAVLYEWRVATTVPWMNRLAPLLGGVFERNHDWVMARGAEGLAGLLGCPLLASD